MIDDPEKLGQGHANAWNAERARQRIPIKPAPEPMPALDTDQLRARIGDWQKAVQIIDNTEPLIRDVIERGLSNVAGLSGTRMGEARVAAAMVMKQIARIRARAIKQAFRYLRDTAP